MGDVVSLGKARKSRDKAQKRLRADANAAKFGRTKAERTAEERAAEQARARLDAHLRDPGPAAEADPDR